MLKSIQATIEGITQDRAKDQESLNQAKQISDKGDERINSLEEEIKAVRAEAQKVRKNVLFFPF